VHKRHLQPDREAKYDFEFVGQCLRHLQELTIINKMTGVHVKHGK
jgi:hypothetical protein